MVFRVFRGFEARANREIVTGRFRFGDESSIDEPTHGVKLVEDGAEKLADHLGEAIKTLNVADLVKQNRLLPL